MYGTEVRKDQIKGYHRRLLLRKQRKVILRLIKVYRAVSTDTELDIAGVVPLHLEVETQWVVGELGQFSVAE